METRIQQTQMKPTGTEKAASHAGVKEQMPEPQQSKVTMIITPAYRAEARWGPLPMKAPIKLFSGFPGAWET